MIFLSLAVFGWKSYQQLPINLMPDISYPTLTVRTEYAGAAPEDVEKMLTRPLEETLAIVPGMVEISSISSPGLSEIIMEFTWDTDMNTAQQDVRDRLDLYEPPREVTQKPVILRYDPTLDPVMRVAISGGDLSDIADPSQRSEAARSQLTVIREAAERHVKADLEGELGIAQVSVKGGREEEIQILVDSEKLKNIGLSLREIATSLAQQNINLSGGRLRDGKTEFSVRTLNEFQDVGEIGAMLLLTPGGRTIRLDTVARVYKGTKDRDTIVRLNGGEAVELEIYKWGDANTVQVCNKLKDLFGFPRQRSVIERLFREIQRAGMRRQGLSAEEEHERMLAQTLRSRLPDNARVTLISDQSRFIVASVKEVQQTALQGGLLALIVLAFFLREARSTFITSISIPISIVATFIPMFMRGISLNIMSLGGLALGVGMLVDNSIVVLESIFRCREEGDSPLDAAERGTKEVAGAVTASTLTTIAVFLPIAFVEGIAGQLFRDLALTVTFSLLASLLVALYLIPMVYSRQGVAFSRGPAAVWMLRGYREGRERGRGRLRSLLGVLPAGVRYAWEWLAESARSDLQPTLAAFRREGGHGGGLLGLVRRALGVVVAPVLLVVFVCRVALKSVGAAFLIVFFPLCLCVAGAVWLVAGLIRLLLWGPMRAFNSVFELFRDGYTAVLRHLLTLSPIILAVVAGLAFHAATVVKDLGRELIPPMRQAEFGIRVEAPAGTRLEETERRALMIEQLVRAFPEVETVAVEIGAQDTRAEGERGENVAKFSVMLRDPETNVRYQDEIIERMREEVSSRTTDTVTFTLPALFSFKTAVELQIRGDDLEELRRVGERVLAAIEDVPGLKDTELSMKQGYPEVIIELDRELLAAKNLTADLVAQRLLREVHGDVPTRFSRAGDKIDIRVRSDRERLSSLRELRQLSVVEGYPPLPLSSVARISVKEGPSEIRRIDQRQVAVVTANVEGRDLGAVSEDILARLESVERPVDFGFELGGQNRELRTSYESLQFALLLAIFLVYVVMASQFESIWHPALVMFSVPLAFIGVIYVLAWSGINLSIVVFIGGIILAGIVVNNAIVLVDYINQLRARGLSKRDAVVEAGRVRLRPILMTTLTTVLGLAPMALWTGQGAEIRQPMAVTVMAGLSFSTLLTLVIIPMSYYLFGGRDKAKA